MLHQDFETRHPKELKNLGSFAYANQDMGLWCVCYYNDVTGESGVWKPGDPVPEPFLDPFQTHAAWNANFERDVYERVLVPRFGFPPTEIEQWVDPSAVSRYRGYPGGLKAAAMLLGDANTQKDDEGRALMLKMAKPRYLDKRGNPVWWDDPEDISRLIEYCQQDVVAEVAIHKKLGELPYHEQEIFWLDRRINERGVKIDTDAVERMIHLVEQQDRRANSRLRVITGGDVERVTDISGTLLWLDQRGVLLPNLSKQTVEKTLRDAKVLGSALDAEAQEVLQIRQDNAKTSTAKLKAMKNAVAEDGRIHGMFQYYGAHTGRWTGRLVQLQNLPQGMNLDPQAIEDLHQKLREQTVHEWLDQVEAQYGPPMPVISSMIRSLIVAEGDHKLWVYDYKSIEPRVLSWLAEETTMLEGYRQGKDIYKALAAQIYQVPEEQVTKQQRQFGKMGILGCGYGMGTEKFFQSCLNMGLNTTPEEAFHVVSVYRAYYSSIKKFWKNSEQALRDAFDNAGTPMPFGCDDCLVAYRERDGDLQVKLPSGRSLFYPRPFYNYSDDDWRPSLTYITVMGTKAIEKSLYGGLIVENIVQAVARDLMCHAMLHMDRAGFNITMTVHDEIVCEQPDGTEGRIKEFEKIMTTPPSWGQGIPIEVEGYVSTRYRK